MDNSGEFRNRLIGGFIVICIAMIAVSGAFLAKNFLNLTVVGAVLAGIVLFLLLFLLHIQRVNRREINDLKYYMSKPSDIEDGLIRRIDELSRQVNSSDVTAIEQSLDVILRDNENINVSIAGLDDSLQTLSHRVDVLADRMTITENSISLEYDKSIAPVEQERKVVPLRNSRQPSIAPSGFDQRPDFQGDDDLVNIDERRATALADIGAADLVEHSRNRTLSERLRNAVEHNELELHLQPIVKLSDREPEFYESTLRLKESDGEYVDQRKLNRLVREGRLAAALDSQLLFSAVRVLRTLNELQKRTGLICPLSVSTLENPESFEDTHTFLAANVALAGSLILEIDQSALEELNSNCRECLSRLVDLGFPLLLNNIQNFEMDGPLLHSAGFRQLKISVNELLNISDHGNIDEYVTDFSEEMENCGLTVIVSDIELESQVIHLIDFDLPLGQGSLFSPSRPVKPELLKATYEQNTMSGLIIA